MTKIKELFDPSKDIYRSIEKVVTFGSLQSDALKREITEYVVTEKLKRNFEKVLDNMTIGMENSSNEIGIWVSGFYGSESTLKSRLKMQYMRCHYAEIL
jgi:hypothetical protein